ncbi:hypothetical protein GGTG_12377 [Gaeumannomyces tritici R3-111a-1]|uniref:Uncharacterized protein n=1 Tax=Gaeumannomyces tritici (strain R3-111a-1) TaxID=644352 RepID=J3PFV2_GAET3|nr:hypothetical protein GGTG_12377 [Gaeumannomyces tritici R3-111a-1]EJT70204.1 hypothetical protein GGTG_12377 [Gaeumannomyces tritici R3-111a-1]
MAPRQDTSPFRKLVLVPLWLIRDLVMTINIALLALIIFTFAYADRTNKHDELGASWQNLRKSGITAVAVIAIASVNMAIILLCLILDLVCLVKRIRHSLTPRFFLVTNWIQTIIWTVLFALSMVGTRAVAPIVIAVMIYLTFIGMLIYAIVVYRHEKRNPPVDEHNKMDFVHQPHMA